MAAMCSVGNDKSLSLAAVAPSTMLGANAQGNSAMPGARRTAGGASRTMLGSNASPAPTTPGSGGGSPGRIGGTNFMDR
jgi:hypothetical protein